MKGQDIFELMQSEDSDKTSADRLLRAEGSARGPAGLLEAKSHVRPGSFPRAQHRVSAKERHERSQRR